jgi:glycerol-3-phosphate acyltransferase PlsY
VIVLGYLLAAVGGYFLGSPPTGYLVARVRGVDIRAVGSGNIGATNVVRVLGKPIGILVLLGDAGKGALACWLLPLLVEAVLGGREPVRRELIAMVAGVGAILGHNFTCWLRFKGGKGIATSAGVLLALIPAACGVAFVLWVVVFLLSRYVSVASLAAAFTLPIVVWLTHAAPPFIVMAAVVGALAIYRHKANIQRLLAGTESRFQWKK